ncbi:hypothetical protein WMY93_033703 [Mugilogobius chulae]|uniref:Transmembrane protein 220 n=1 Tax=Mugilogobius chulae TaxID=88201 RepID=A0AAW0MSY7_9GOBI
MWLAFFFFYPQAKNIYLKENNFLIKHLYMQIFCLGKFICLYEERVYELFYLQFLMKTFIYSHTGCSLLFHCCIDAAQNDKVALLLLTLSTSRTKLPPAVDFYSRCNTFHIIFHLFISIRSIHIFIHSLSCCKYHKRFPTWRCSEANETHSSPSSMLFFSALVEAAAVVVIVQMGEVAEKPENARIGVVWRICNASMALFFGLATYVQINDPDAGLWMVGYGVPSLLCALIGWWPQVTECKPWRRVADLHVLLSSAAVSILGWTLVKEQVTDIFQREEGREFCGLMLTVFWLLLCRHSGRSHVGVLRVSTAAAIALFPFVSWVYYYVHKELRADWPQHCKTAL